MKYTADISRIKRHYLPADFVITDWPGLEPYFTELTDRPIVSEDACWRQIRMTCDTANKELEEAFNYFYLEIQPKIQPFSDLLNKKLVDSPFVKELDPKKYFTYLRNVKKNIELFR